MTTRTGMNALISVVRGLADAGSEDWTNDGNQVEYWESSEIQRVLDRHRFYADRAALQPIQSYSGGTVVYTEYRAGIGDIESGTAVFKIGACFRCLYVRLCWRSGNIRYRPGGICLLLDRKILRPKCCGRRDVANQGRQRCEAVQLLNRRTPY